MLDVAAEMMGFALNQVLHGGAEPEPVGMGSPIVAPYGAYPTADGQTAVLGTTSNREWRRLTRDLLDRPDLAEDPRYARNDDRVRHRAELDRIVGDWCAQRDLAEIQRRADEAGIGNARLNGVRDLAEHEQLAQRGRWRQVGSPAGPVPALLPAGPRGRLAGDQRAGARPGRGHRRHPGRGPPGSRPCRGWARITVMSKESAPARTSGGWEPAGTAAARRSAHGERVTAKGLRTREELVAAARRVFERDGYTGARVADIAAEAGLAHGSFYTYFSSKQDVFLA